MIRRRGGAGDRRVARGSTGNGQATRALGLGGARDGRPLVRAFGLGAACRRSRDSVLALAVPGAVAIVRGVVRASDAP